MTIHHPSDITLHQQSRTLEIAFSDGACFELPCEYLRVYSPSAEVRGHSGNMLKLVAGKEHVNIKNMIPIGQYAIKIFLMMATNPVCMTGTTCISWVRTMQSCGVII